MTIQLSYPDVIFKEFTLTADKARLDLEYLYQLLCIPSRYSTGLPPERLPIVIQNSICFGVFREAKQIGFGRVVTDCSEFASLWDLFIDEPYRKQGIGQALLKFIFNHPNLRGVFRWFLMTEDAHGLYEKFGFKTETYNRYMMMKVNPGN